MTKLNCSGQLRLPIVAKSLQPGVQILTTNRKMKFFRTPKRVILAQDLRVIELLIFDNCILLTRIISGGEYCSIWGRKDVRLILSIFYQVLKLSWSFKFDLGGATGARPFPCDIGEVTPDDSDEENVIKEFVGFCIGGPNTNDQSCMTKIN